MSRVFRTLVKPHETLEFDLETFDAVQDARGTAEALSLFETEDALTPWGHNSRKLLVEYQDDTAGSKGIGYKEVYKFVVHNDEGGKVYRLDPWTRQVDWARGGSVVIDPGSDWTPFTRPAYNEMVLYELHVGTFNKTYFLFLALNTARKRKSNRSRISSFSGLSFSDFASTASDFKMTSVSRKPFLNSVLPELTISQMPSAKPMFGAISTEPEMTWISALILFFSKNDFSVKG